MDFLRRRVLRLPGAVHALQKLFYLSQALSRCPALKKEDRAIGQQPLGAGILLRLSPQLIQVHPQDIPGLGILNNGRSSRLLCLLVVRKALVQGVHVLRGCARGSRKSDGTEIKRP